MVCLEARLLGAYLKVNGNITGEIGRRVKRLMFISFVQGGALSGLTSMTTLRVPGPCTAWDAAKSVRANCASNVHRNRQKQPKEVFRSWALLGS